MQSNTSYSSVTTMIYLAFHTVIHHHHPMTEKSSPLLNKLKESIAAADGFLPFDAFMECVLYHDDYGYYQQKEVFGAAGDFVTAPDMGPWLSLAFADIIDHGWQQMGCPKQWGLVEQGGGSGRLLSQVVRVLHEHYESSPSHLFAVEKSDYWRAKQTIQYQQSAISVHQVSTLDELSTDVPLLLFSNELPDAFPVQCFVWQQGECVERGIAVNDGGALVWAQAKSAMKTTPMIDASIMDAWHEGYISEHNTGLASWQQALGQLLQRNGGIAFTLDYGYSQQEYYRPNRIEGTLMGHKSHQVVHNILTDIGNADITAHVDFTSMARTGMTHGLTPIAYMSQGAWLASSPLLQSGLQQLAANPSTQSMRLIAHAKRLMLPHAGMGESFKLLIQSTMPMVLPEALQSMNRLGRLNVD